MAKGAYVLYLTDRVAAPAFELMRRICQPRSRSMPHVTVRFSKKEIPEYAEDLYDQVWVDRLYLSGSDSFDEAESADGISTLFVRCESEELERLSYKPDFPDSVFHLTVYDGKASLLARDIHDLLKTFEWNLVVPLPPTHVESVRKSASAGGSLPKLSTEARALLADLTNGEIYPEALMQIDSASRLELIRLVATDLHRKLRPGVSGAGKGRVRNFEPMPAMSQGELWSFFDLVRDSGGVQRSSEYRRFHRQNGLFITPPEIAHDIVAYAHDILPAQSYPVDFGDPAVGSGIFVAALVGEFGRKDIASVVAVESDQRRAAFTAERWRHVGIEVNSDDFVERIFSSEAQGALRDESWLSQNRNLLIANPPYIRSQGLDPVKVSAWRMACTQKLGLTPDSRSDLYVYFVLASHFWLQEGGVAFWLLPTEFMFTHYGRLLKQYLLEKVDLVRVHIYGGRSKFSNARVSSCVIIYRKLLTKSPSSSITFTRGGPLTEPEQRVVVNAQDLDASRKWNGVFDSHDSADVDPKRMKLGDLFVVRRGIATGANRYFVISAEMAQALEIPLEWRKPVLPKAHLIGGDVIDEDLLGDPAGIPFSWLIDCAESLPTVESRSPLFAKYLKEIDAEVGTRSLVKRRNPFYRQEKNRSPRYVFTYMSRSEKASKRFKLNRSRAVALNNYLCLYPQAGVESWLGQSRDNELILLQSLHRLSELSIASAGREYADGLLKLEPRELRDLAVPDLPQTLIEHLRP